MTKEHAEFLRRCYPKFYLYGLARKKIAFVKHGKPTVGFTEITDAAVNFAAQSAINDFVLEGRIRAGLKQEIT